MFMTLKQDWDVLDATTTPHKQAKIPAGRHEIERIPNPSYPGKFWLVLKGTRIGASEGSLREWPDHITFEE